MRTRKMFKNPSGLARIVDAVRSLDTASAKVSELEAALAAANTG